jgi:hypothetical protein
MPKVRTRIAALLWATLSFLLCTGQPAAPPQGEHSHEYEDQISPLVQLEGSPVTRFELAYVFARYAQPLEATLLGEEPPQAAPLPPDVAPDHWAAAAVGYLASREFLKYLWPSGNFDGDKPATREDVALLFAALADRLKPAYKQNPAPKTVQLDRIAGEGDALRALQRLATEGWLPYESPVLLAQPGSPISPPVLAVAFSQHARALGLRLQKRLDSLNDPYVR